MKNQASRPVRGAREHLDLQWCGLLNQARWQVGGKKSYDQNQTMGNMAILHFGLLSFSIFLFLFGLRGKKKMIESLHL